MAEPIVPPERVERLAELPLEPRFGTRWRIAVGASLLLVLVLAVSLAMPIVTGVGAWGNDIPFVWGFDLANYGWWIGIANGAALFAALLVLWRARLRLAINRLAETLAFAAAFCAGLFPVFHLGHPLLAYWMAPYPTHTGLWPQPMSVLTWDFWAIIAYFVTIALFGYVGLIPDLAMLRDRARQRWKARLYAVAALGWLGSNRQWALQQATHRLIALSLIPFLFVMQTIVALELATTIVPDWHDTGLPVRMVVSGFASGLGVVMFAAAAFGPVLGLRPAPTDPLDELGRIVLATALVSAFVVALTTLIEWLGPEGADSVAEWTTGPAAWLSWTSVVLSKLVPQLLWFESVRRSRIAAAAIGLLLAIGVWIDHLAVIVLPLANDRLIDPASLYLPSLAEIGLLAGTIGLFALLTLIAARIIPIVSVYEARRAAEELG